MSHIFSPQRLLSFLALLLPAVAGNKTELYIGALFPMSGDWAGGVACKPAALMAEQDINAEASILPDYRLRLDPRDSRCSPGLGVKCMYELLYKEPTKSMFLTGCSTVTTFVAQAAKMWNLIVVSLLLKLAARKDAPLLKIPLIIERSQGV